MAQDRQSGNQNGHSNGNGAEPEPEPFSSDEIQRYSRQLILPQFGMTSQQRLRAARVLIIGLGGLGTPAALYLAGAGVGALALVDRSGDVVESSNLHRQIAYTMDDVNVTKLQSLTAAIQRRNPHVEVIHPLSSSTSSSAGFDNNNALDIIANSRYDVVLDCTDNVRARYVVGDACAAAAITLVSGAAIGLSGQLSVHAPGSGCYRCVFPAAPPPGCVGSCDAAGVLGPVPGIIGTYMALEAIKLLSQFKSSEPLIGRLLIFDAASAAAPFRSVRLRGTARPDCIACGPTEMRINVTTYDYNSFLNGGPVSEKQKQSDSDLDVDPKYRMTVDELAAIRKSRLNCRLDEDGHDTQKMAYTLIDVRPANEFAICHLDEAVSVPLETVRNDTAELARLIKIKSETCQTILMCRRGNASRRALNALRQAGAENIMDVIGGLQQWQKDIDSDFPMY